MNTLYLKVDQQGRVFRILFVHPTEFQLRAWATSGLFHLQIVRGNYFDLSSGCLFSYDFRGVE